MGWHAWAAPGKLQGNLEEAWGKLLGSLEEVGVGGGVLEGCPSRWRAGGMPKPVVCWRDAQAGGVLEGCPSRWPAAASQLQWPQI